MSIQDDSLHEVRSGETWRATFAAQLDQRRARAQELLEEKRLRFAELETRLGDNLAQIEQHWASLDQDLATRQSQQLAGQSQAEQQAQDLAQQLADLASHKDQLLAQQAACQTAQDELHAQQETLLTDLQRRLAQIDARQQAVATDEQQLHARQAELAAQSAKAAAEQASLQTQLAQLQTATAELRQQQQALELERQKLASREQATQQQRRAIAKELRSRKSAIDQQLAASLAQSKASTAGRELALQLRLAELEKQYRQLEESHKQQELRAEKLEHQTTEEAAQASGLLWEELSASRLALETALGESQRVEADRVTLAADLETLKEKLAEIQEKRRQQAQAAAEREVDWDRQRKELEGQLGVARLAAATSSVPSPQLANLQKENDDLYLKLHEAEEQIKQLLAAAEESDESTSSSDDLQRRLELALTDLRELKTKNADLQESLAKSKREGASGPVVRADLTKANWSKGMDWETQKKVLLERMEADLDESQPEDAALKIRLEDALRVTEAALEAKDHELQERVLEIEELRGLLQNQSNSIGQMAVGASVFAGMLDSDELIRMERENLRVMQETMREQLRKAEVDISLERARVGRERTEFEERLQAFEKERAQWTQGNPGSAAGTSDKSRKSPGGRWLARLGLGKGDQGE